MGVKIMGPPNGDEAVADAMPFSNGIVIVTRAVQAYEATRAQGTHKITEEDLDLSDNWIRFFGSSCCQWSFKVVQS